MRPDLGANIWAIDLHLLSGRDKGHIFVQRANQIVGEALSDPASYRNLFQDGRVRRKVLAGIVGCHRSALTANPGLRALIDEVEGRKVDASEDSEKIGPREGSALSLPPIVQAVLGRLKQDCRISGRYYRDRIICSDRSCRIDGLSYEIPTIVWPDGLAPEASAWLRDLLVTSAVEGSTAKQYAKVLRAFLRHCREKGREWKTVNDDFLRAWRDGRRKQVDDQQVLTDLGTIFGFYEWAEHEGILKWHVGIYDKLPKGFKRRNFPITARRVASSRKQKLDAGWGTTLKFRASRSIVGRRNTPTDRQVMSVHEQLLKSAHGERDALMAAWAEETGSRRFEMLQVRKDNLPTKEGLEQLIVREENYEIHIEHRKRGAKAPLSANPYLLLATLDWVAGPRQDIVDHCTDNLVGYKEPQEIFISSRTGKVLTPDSVTSLMGKAFRAADVKKASLHRLRAKAIVEQIERLVDGFEEMKITVEPGSQWAETILVLVAETAGQASPLSLRPYLNTVLHRRLSLTEADRRKRLAEKTRDLERRALAARAQLEEDEVILAAVRLARTGKVVEADVVLRHWLERFSFEGCLAPLAG